MKWPGNDAYPRTHARWRQFIARRGSVWASPKLRKRRNEEGTGDDAERLLSPHENEQLCKEHE